MAHSAQHLVRPFRNDEAGAQLAVVRSTLTIVWRLVLAVVLIELLSDWIENILGIKTGSLIDYLESLAVAVLAVPLIYWLSLRPLQKLARQQAELANETRFAAIANAMQEGLLITDSAFRIRFANQAIGKMIGISAVGLLGTDCRTLISSDAAEYLTQEAKKFLDGHPSPVINSGRFQLDARKKGAASFPAEITINSLPEERERLFVSIVQDITERRLRDELVRQSEAQFRLLADEAPACLWLSDADGLCTYVNKPWLELTGRPLEQHLAEGWSDCVHANDRECVVADFREAIRQRQEFTTEYRIRAADGTCRWVLDRGHARFLPDGTYAGHIGARFDITERKLTDEKLWERTAQLNAVIENSPLGIVALNPNGRVTLCNPAFEQLFQMTLTDLAGAKLDEIIAPPHLLREASGLTARASIGERTQLMSQRRRKDGTLVDVEIFGVPLVIEGETRGSYGIYQDLTARRDLEKAIRESEERYRQLFEQANDAIILIDPLTRTVVDANRRALEAFELDRASLLGINVTRLETVSQEASEQLERIILTGSPVMFEGHRIDSKGREAHDLVSASLVEFGGKRVIQAIVRDITERKRMEAALRDSEARFRLVADSVPVILSMINPEGRGTFHNKEAIEYTGETSEQLGAGGWVARIHPEDRDRAVCHFDQCQQSRSAFSQEYRLLGKNGDYRWFVDQGRPRFAPDGTFQGHTICVVDITDRKLADEKLQASERRMRTVLDSMPVAVRIVQDRKVAFANPTDAHMHGFQSPEEEIGTDASLQIVSEERQRVLGYYGNRLSGKPAPKRYKVRRVRRDGSEFLAENTVVLIQFENRQAHLIAIQDLTDREKLDLYESLLPVCCVCGKIRDDQGVPAGEGRWERLDHYVAKHSEAQISHTFCPECLEEYKRREGLG